MLNPPLAEARPSLEREGEGKLHDLCAGGGATSKSLADNDAPRHRFLRYFWKRKCLIQQGLDQRPVLWRERF